MSENKTRPTDADVTAFLDAIADPQRRADCQALAAMMGRLTGQPPVLWGPGIVGFGRYHYRYGSGREGDAPVTGFAPRKGDISVYLSEDDDGHHAPLLARLGRHRMGKVCLSIRRLADVDLGVLEQLVAGSIADVKRRHG